MLPNFDLKVNEVLKKDKKNWEKASNAQNFLSNSNMERTSFSWWKCVDICRSVAVIIGPVQTAKFQLKLNTTGPC